MILGVKRVFIDDNYYIDYSEFWVGWFIKRDYWIVFFFYSVYEFNIFLREEVIYISDVFNELKVFFEKDD